MIKVTTRNDRATVCLVDVVVAVLVERIDITKYRFISANDAENGCCELSAGK